MTIKKIALAAISLSFAGLVSAASSANEDAAAVASAINSTAGNLPLPAGVSAKSLGSSTHDVPHPLGDQQRELRKLAKQQQLTSSASTGVNGSGKVVEVAKGQYVELSRQGEDSIWTVVADFGEAESPFGVLQGGLIGPARNEIPEPSADNNTTIWREDFSRDYFMDMLFNDSPGANSMRNFYIEQSSGRYAVNGDVTEWVSVPFRAAHYGRNFCGGAVCFTTWWFVEDALNAWYQSQLDAGMTAAEIDDYLSQYDVWDRYDFDGDGNFDEADGYIDHFQAVHAGEGAEAGGGAYGQDSIWSHRWYVQTVCIGCGGPTLDDGTVVPNGGIPVGGSKYWIGDYTIEPENGGVGVFAHEFGHDLDLPDLYDTAGGSNSTGFWTLMSSGSWTSDGTVDIGSKPTHMGAWEKFQLGWLNYEVGFSGQKSEHKLGPAETNTKQAQGLFVIAPNKVVVEELAQPYEGSYFYYSGSGANLENMMFRGVDLPANATLSAKVILDIEADWDYAYLAISTDGVNITHLVETNLSTSDDPNGQNFGNGITGSSGGNWVDLTADLSAFSGPVGIGFFYWTDGFVNPAGIMVDAIEISGTPFDGAEADAGWEFNGFSVTTGSETNSYFNAYVAEFRQYRGYDEALRTGPYNFGFQDNPALGDYVEHYPYQDGLLISYWDDSQVNNNTSQHPGEGLILPVDAHPEPLIRQDAPVPWSSSKQTYDSTFGFDATDPITLHVGSSPSFHPSLPGVSMFNAMNDYWSAITPLSGVNPPKSNTRIRIKSISARGSFMQVEVR